jgi:hypothetical protein
MVRHTVTQGWQIVRLAALATALFCTWSGGAAAAPGCAEGPETVGATIIGTPCADVIRLPRNVTTVLGEGGDDVLYGQRGNHSLFGGEGADRLYGGVGDDRLRGGPASPRRRVAFSFGASEADSRFRCKLDRRPFGPCRSPRAYLVRPGRHAFRVFAIDPAGNRDRTPALFRFRVR